MAIPNTLGDLNNTLFEVLERLNDTELTGDALADEIKRGNTISKVASQIVANASLILKAQEVYSDANGTDIEPSKLLHGE